jgi:hypothetical protein
MPQIEREAADSLRGAQPDCNLSFCGSIFAAAPAQRMIGGFLLEKEPGE